MKLIVKILFISSFFILFFISKLAFDDISHSKIAVLEDSCNVYTKQMDSMKIFYIRQIDSLRKLVPMETIKVK